MAEPRVRGTAERGGRTGESLSLDELEPGGSSAEPLSLDELAPLYTLLSRIRAKARADEHDLVDATWAALEALEDETLAHPADAFAAIREAIAMLRLLEVNDSIDPAAARTLADRVRACVEERTTHAEDIQLFAGDAVRYLDEGGEALARMRRDPAPEHVRTAFRAMHTLKGAAGMMGFRATEHLARVGETALEPIRAGQAVPTPDLLDALTGLVEAVRAGLADPGEFEWAAAADAVERALASAKALIDDTRLGDLLVRRGVADRATVDLALAIQGAPLGEALVRLEAADATEVERTIDVQRRLRSGEQIDIEAAHGGRTLTLAIDVRKLCALGESVNRLRNALAPIGVTEDPALAHVHAEFDEICASVVALERVPVAVAFRKVNVAVKDLCKRLSKKVRVETRGGDVEAHRDAVDRLADALLHVVRNAVDHGVEPPDQRVACGKNPTATISLIAALGCDELGVEVRDDGRGFDRARILEQALARRIAVPSNPSDAEVFALVFEPGFSTATEITDTSGRGVGLDVVKHFAEEEGGRVEVRSEPGAGSSIRIVLSAVGVAAAPPFGSARHVASSVRADAVESADRGDDAGRGAGTTRRG